MCLAIPVKVIKIKENSAQVNMAGVKRLVDVRFLEGLQVGDYILVHAGFAIEKIDEEQAKETLKLLDQIYYDE
ncbi:MAG: HypC/HybG/HupF family hydrogenase formation chaperone [Candidatus Omnitrophica bacterium]|jgi:hydrogenase expression/formation protein HypC|nr:HypC/HybG/HupF family hydrogenase formation chaperone [Candidatus Omnitrophota bacterium]